MKAYIIPISILFCFILNSCSQKQENNISQTDLPKEDIISTESAVAIETQPVETPNSNVTVIYEDDQEESEEESNEKSEEDDGDITEDNVSNYFKKFKTRGSKSKSIIPQGWEIIADAKGDLNGDGIDDIAFFTRKNKKNRNEESDPNPNSIVLAIYWGDKDNGFNQYKLFSSIVSSEDEFNHLNELKIDITSKKVLAINANYSGDSADGFYSLKYRYQNGAFYKIGYDSQGVDRPAGNVYTISINYLTGKTCTKTRDLFEDNSPEKTEWETFNEPLKELGSETYIDY